MEKLYNTNLYRFVNNSNTNDVLLLFGYPSKFNVKFYRIYLEEFLYFKKMFDYYEINKKEEMKTVDCMPQPDYHINNDTLSVFCVGKSNFHIQIDINIFDTVDKKINISTNSIFSSTSMLHINKKQEEYDDTNNKIINDSEYNINAMEIAIYLSALNLYMIKDTLIDLFNSISLKSFIDFYLFYKKLNHNDKEKKEYILDLYHTILQEKLKDNITKKNKELIKLDLFNKFFVEYNVPNTNQEFVFWDMFSKLYPTNIDLDVILASLKESIELAKNKKNIKYTYLKDHILQTLAKK